MMARVWPDRLRLGLLGALVLSLALPMAWISLTRLLLYVVVLAMLCSGLLSAQRAQPLLRHPSLPWLLAALGLLALSFLWTSAPWQVAAASFVKHGRLLGMFLILLLIRAWSEGLWALRLFVASQAVLCLLSWVLFFTVVPPPLMSSVRGVVFTSYLDQSIIFSITAGLLWQLRKPLNWPPALTWLVCALLLGNAMFLMRGRTGFLVGMAVIALLAVWSMPRRWRIAVLAGVPLLGLALVPFAPERVQPGAVWTEIRSANDQELPQTSAGWRLIAWKRSMQAIAQAPVAGHGVGAWTTTIHRLQGPTAAQVFGDNTLSNPHQEFLLWGVELGLPGVLLLVGFLVALTGQFAAAGGAIAQAGLLVLGALTLAALANSILYDAHIGDFFVTVLGLLLALCRLDAHAR
jgi:O-antigen ligase